MVAATEGSRLPSRSRTGAAGIPGPDVAPTTDELTRLGLYKDKDPENRTRLVSRPAAGQNLFKGKFRLPKNTRPLPADPQGEIRVLVDGQPDPVMLKITGMPDNTQIRMPEKRILTQTEVAKLLEESNARVTI